MSRHMQRKYRKGKQLGLWVSDEVAERLSALSKRVGLAQSQLLREALDLLFAKHELVGSRVAKKGRAAGT
jgi:hypothetical protein